MPSRPRAIRPDRGIPGSSWKYTPLQHLRETFALFCQGLFAAAPPGAFHWTPDLEHTELVITDENPINTEKIGARPAVNFVRGPIRFSSIGMDDMVDYNFSTGKKTKEIFIPGTMSINCCSSNDLESEQVAWVIGEMTWLLRELLLQEGGLFEVGREISMGSPSPAGSIVANDMGSEWYATTLTVPYQLTRRSAFTPLGRTIVQSIQLSLSTRRSLVGSRGTPDAGYNVSECPPEAFSSASDAQGQTPDPAGLRESFLPKQQPTTPATRVCVTRPYNHRQGLRPPSMGGAPIPINRPCVEESEVTSPGISGTVKT